MKLPIKIDGRGACCRRSYFVIPCPINFIEISLVINPPDLKAIIKKVEQ